MSSPYHQEPFLGSIHAALAARLAAILARVRFDAIRVFAARTADTLVVVPFDHCHDTVDRNARMCFCHWFYPLSSKRRKRSRRVCVMTDARRSTAYATMKHNATTNDIAIKPTTYIPSGPLMLRRARRISTLRYALSTALPTRTFFGRMPSNRLTRSDKLIGVKPSPL